MSGVSIHVDDSAVRGLLAQLSGALDDLSPVMAAIGAAVVTDTQLNFRAESDPWGTPWTPLTEATKRRRRGTEPYKILRDTGRLANSINYQLLGTDGVAVGTDVVYAATHQLGRGKIPARPFMPLDPETFRVDLPSDLDAEINRILRDALDEALRN